MALGRHLALYLALALAFAACSTSTETATKPDAAKPADVAALDAPDDSTATDAPDPKYTGKCAAGPTTCDDGNPCTVDDCDPLVGCTATPKACDDGDPCTIDSCDLNSGACTHAAQGCDDNNACTIGTCTAGEGCTFSALDCDDGNACTSDGCTPSAGCQIGTVNCDDNKTCSADSCDPVSGCQHVIPPGAVCCEAISDCDDQNVCTVESCDGGICGHAPVFGCCKSEADCNDHNPCTVDTCDASKGACSNVFSMADGCCTADSQCNDSNTCTLDRCIGNQCAHETHCCAKTEDCTAPAIAACAEGTCTPAGCALVPVSSSACCKPQVAATGFEGTGWAVSLAPATKGYWSVAEVTDPKEGKSVLAFAASPMAILGGGPLAEARLAEVNLPAGTKVTLHFWYRWQPFNSDFLRLRISTSLGSWTVWQAAPITGWQEASVDLTGFAARPATVKARLTFQAQTNSAASGPMAVDAITLSSTCAATTCANNADCNDNLAATAEACVGGLCSFAVGALYCEPGDACNDGNACTVDACLNNMCTHNIKPNCCLASAECEDNNPCTTDLCNSNLCVHAKMPGTLCCASAADCNDSNACTADSCPTVGMPCAHTKTDANCCVTAQDCGDGIDCTIDSCKASQCQHKSECCSKDLDCLGTDLLCMADSCVSGMCQHKPTGMPGCCTTDMQSFDFENGLPDFWTLSAATTPVKWQVVTGKKFHSGSSALYYGDVAKGNYDNGAANSGTITSKPVTLPQGETLEVAFWLYMDTEPSTSYDAFTVQIQTSFQSYTVWDKNTPGFGMQSWFHGVVNLSAFAGQTVSIVFLFNTGDSIANTTEGVYLDDVALHRSCAAASCGVDSDCDDKQTFSTDKCVSGQCTYVVMSAAAPTP